MGYVNPYFAQDWAGIKAHGMVRGAYHYFHADTDPMAQADHFLTTVGTLEAGDLPAVLDLEETQGQSASTVAKKALAWMQAVEAKTGKKPILYTGPSFFSNTLGEPAGFGQYPLWIANYGVSCPNVPPSWSKATFWQYSATGPVPGIGNVDVDQDKFNGSLADLHAFIGDMMTAGTGGQLNGNDAITLVNWASDGHVEAFVKDTSGAVMHTSTTGAKDDWSALTSIGDGAKCGVASVMWPDKNLPDVFAPGSGGRALHASFDGKAWSKLDDFGGVGLSSMSTLSWKDGHVEVLARGSDHAIWHNYYDLTSKAWAGWSSMGGAVSTGAAAITWSDGHAELFAADEKTQTAYHNWSGDFPGGWHGWVAMAGDVDSKPIPVRWPDGHLEVFARTKMGTLAHASFDTMAGDWTSFAVVSNKGTIVGDPSVVAAASNGVSEAHVFGRDAKGDVVQAAWDGKTLTDFLPVGTITASSDPLGWARADGSLEVFVIDSKGALSRSLHSDKGWSAWSAIGGAALDACLTTSSGFGGGSSTGVGGGDPGSTTSGAGGGDNGAPVAGKGCSCRVGESSDGAGSLVGLAIAGLLTLRRRRAVTRC
jgi:MYXO-CTERM domain-containing protein